MIEEASVVVDFRSAASLVISHSVDRIGEDCFLDRQTLERVSFESVSVLREIGNRCLLSADSLK
jgi:hypothetical protein